MLLTRIAPNIHIFDRQINLRTFQQEFQHAINKTVGPVITLMI